MFKALILSVFLLLASGLSAQVISGYVYDDRENLPLEGAFVYLDGTTISASTDARGYFSLDAGGKSSALLVIRFSGFKSLQVDNPLQYKSPFKVKLTEDAIQMDELVIRRDNRFTRKQMLKAFREQFLGMSKAGSSCKIKNENDITLYYDSGTNTLHAQASKPLEIDNERLQYTVMFDLADFYVDYSIKSLSKTYVRKSFFSGTTFFKDRAKGTAADKRRCEAYLGSPAHLLKTIANKDWAAQKFQLYIDSFRSDPDEHFVIKDTLGLRKVSVVKQENAPSTSKILISSPNGNQAFPVKSRRDALRYTILYNGKEQSFFTIDQGVFYVDNDGQHMPLEELSFGGYMSGLKAGDMLPLGYECKE